jgi:E3 ubiquitin-protein ligase SHPRH
MGLGKSIEMISLILMNKRLIEIPDITWNDDSESRANNTTSDDDGILQDSTFDEAPRLCSQEVATTSETKLADDIDERLLTFDPYLEQVVVRAKTTLIICPNSIRSQWVEEIQRHAPSLNVFVYTGMTSKQPTPTVRQLGSYDVVITTYHAISRELHFAFFNPGARSMRNERSREDMNRLKSPLVRIQFWRVILDEVQMVNSGVSKAAQVARIVPRVHAWGVTGTPVKKSMADLQGIFIFLRMDPFTNSLVWNQVLASPADFEVIMSTIAIRHTATMVKDDIAIPSQTRYLLSLPFNAVEQNNYQHLFASFLDACGLNDDGSLRNPMESIENGKLSSWFLRLRQACGHARIGQSNRRALGGGPLRTVGDVLNAMLEQTHATLLIDLRRFYLLGIEKGQIREAQRDPVGALELWEEASKGVEPILESVRRELDEFKQEKARREQEIEEQRKMREEEWRENTEDNMGDNALNDGELIDDFDDDETDDNLTTLNIRLKSWLELMHRCYFFIATSHYQIGQIMDEDKKAMEERCGAAEPNPAIKEDPDATPPFSFVALGPTANGNKHESTPDTLPYSSILGNEPSTPNAKSKENLGTAKRRFSVTESPQEARNSSVRIKYDEQKRKVHSEEEMLYYQKAELLRRELLQEPIKKVEGLASTLRKRVKLQKFSVIEDATLEEGKLRLGLESRYLLNAINDLGVALNQQADVIDGWREELIKLLAADLVDQDVDPDGEEYANSLDAQEYAFSYIEVLRQVLADRSLAVAGNADSVMEKANQYSKKSEFEIKLEKTREEIKPLKVERGQDPYEMSLRGLLSRAKRGVTFGERAAVENQLMGQIGRKLSKIYTAQNRGLRELTKEVGFFSDLFNARVAYYKRLQELSDNVESLEFDAADAPRMVKKRTREEKALTASINQQRARQRFLQTLSGDQAKPEEDRICVICQSSFTIGCLTVCGHQFCKDCLQEWWKVNRSCPLCKRRIGVDEVYNFTYRASDIDETMDEPVDNQIGVHDESLSNGIFAAAPRGIVNQVNRMQLTARYSSKIDFIIRHLLWLRSKDPKTQVVIFSQWSEMLDLIGVALSIHRIHYATVQERMDEFKKDKDIACFLLHAKSES